MTFVPLSTFLLESASGVERGTCALVRVIDDHFGATACLVTSACVLPATSSAQLSRAKLYSPLRASSWMGSEKLAPEWVRYAWTEADAGLTFVELSPAGLQWALASGATSYALASRAPTAAATAQSLTHVQRDDICNEMKKEVQVEAVQEDNLQLSEGTSEGMLLDADERLVAWVCATANDSKTAVRIDKIATVFLADRRRLFRYPFGRRSAPLLYVLNCSCFHSRNLILYRFDFSATQEVLSARIDVLENELWEAQKQFLKLDISNCTRIFFRIYLRSHLSSILILFVH